MLKLLVSIVTFFLLLSVNGQKTEVSVSLNSGLFSFAGNSVKNGSAAEKDYTNTFYANNPYGARKGLGEGISVTLKRITKRNFIWGLDIGYESMKSRELVDTLFYTVDVLPYNGTPATGKVFLKTSFFNVFPYFGKRIVLKKVSIDVGAGIEFGLVNTSNESGRIDKEYSVQSDMSHALASIDFRTRLQVSVNYHRYGGYLGYSWGQSDYGGSTGGGCSPGPGYQPSPNVNYKYYSRIIRFGISYRLF